MKYNEFAEALHACIIRIKLLRRKASGELKLYRKLLAYTTFDIANKELKKLNANQMANFFNQNRLAQTLIQNAEMAELEKIVNFVLELEPQVDCASRKHLFKKNIFRSKVLKKEDLKSIFDEILTDIMPQDIKQYFKNILPEPRTIKQYKTIIYLMYDFFILYNNNVNERFPIGGIGSIGHEKTVNKISKVIARIAKSRTNKSFKTKLANGELVNINILIARDAKKLLLMGKQTKKIGQHLSHLILHTCIKLDENSENFFWRDNIKLALNTYLTPEAHKKLSEHAVNFEKNFSQIVEIIISKASKDEESMVILDGGFFKSTLQK